MEKRWGAPPREVTGIDRKQRLRWSVRVLATPLPAVLAGIVLVAGTPAESSGQRQRAAVIIRGGVVVDGTGAPGRTADVVIGGNGIIFVGDASSRYTAPLTVDARGLVVVPGFIDPHAHVMADLSSDDPKRRVNAPYLMQGVTTTVTGNDGGGPVDVGATLSRWERSGIGTNVALYTGFGSIRERLLGMSAAAPTTAQLDSMRALVRHAMTDGALGMSTGLFYAPQSYSTTDEVIALAAATAPDGIYDTHLRDESSYSIGLLGAVAEALRIGREAHIAVHISHIKALGVDVWGKSDSVIALIRSARAAGQVVTADQYPYTASGSSVSASLLPRWAQAGGLDSLRRRVSDPATKARLEREMVENLRRRGGAASLLITAKSRPDLVGKTLDDVAKARGVSAVQAAIDIALTGDASVASFNMQEADIVNFMRQPFIVTGSDGSDGHPRKFGTFPRFFHDYVRGKHVMTFEAAVKRSSAATAEALGITRRGVIKAGYFADIAVIDTARYAERATYEEPELPAVGVEYVFVNGIVAVDHGQVRGVFPGQALRRAGTRPEFPPTPGK